MSERVTPQLHKGLRDLLPEEMIARQRMIADMSAVCERFGFVPLATPAIERMDVLTGSDAGDEAAGSIFRVDAPEDDVLGLRFDLTVPLARVVAQYQDLSRPFRRYQTAPVWRADKPDMNRGRFREFTQFDIDAVGVPSESADVEIMAVGCELLGALGLADAGGFTLRFSSRRILDLLLPLAGIDRSRGRDVFRVLDKLDKIGPEKVRLELTRGYTDDSGDRIEGLGFESAQVDQIERFLAIKDDTRAGVLSKLRELMSPIQGASDEIDSVGRISEHLAEIGYDESRVVLDLSIARGLAYYTGPVFEAVLNDAPQFGSVFGGGRYDGLVQRFLGERIPAVGASVGVDRLLSALVHLGKVELRSSTARVLVTTMDKTLESDYLDIAFELRRAGIATELFLGAQKFRKQLSQADKKGYDLAVLMGSNEKEQGVVTVKDLIRGRATAEDVEREAWLRDRPAQVEVPRAELVRTVKRMLGDGAPR